MKARGRTFLCGAACLTAFVSTAGLTVFVSGAQDQQRVGVPSGAPGLPPPANHPPATQRPAEEVPAANINVDVNLVTIPITVTDSSGRPVASLREEQFTVLEDGVRQTISVFHNEIVPASIGLVIDTSGSMVDKLDDAVDGVNHFVDTIQPNDDVFLISFASFVEVELEATVDRRQFKRAVRRLRPRGSTRL